MNQSELRYLISQNLSNNGFDTNTLQEALSVFVAQNSGELESFEYTQQGVEKLSSMVDSWKSTDIGKRFLSPDIQKIDTSNTPNALKNIVAGFKAGKIKLNQNY